MEEGNPSADGTAYWELRVLCVHCIQGGEEWDNVCFLLCTMESPAHLLVLRGRVKIMVSVRADRYLSTHVSTELIVIII